LFGTQVISLVKRMAMRTVTTDGTKPLCPLRPIIINGKAHYVMFVDTYQAKAVKAESAWQQAQREANNRGKDNPLFTGMLGIWDNVVLHELEWLHRRTGAGGVTADEFFDTTSDSCADGITVARGLFCGAQAAGMAWGMKPAYKAKEFDYGRKHGVAVDMIYGSKQAAFASTGGSDIPFGVITVDTAVVLD
jgi:N4-gp56 family major capsid protein